MGFLYVIFCDGYHVAGEKGALIALDSGNVTKDTVFVQIFLRGYFLPILFHLAADRDKPNDTVF